MCHFSSIKSLPRAEQARLLELREVHHQVLTRLRKSCKDESEGFFGPDSMTWKFYREPCILLGSSRALLLQIAHPAIAAGVKTYSNFQENMAGRAHRTFTSMTRIWFGDTKTAISSAKRLYHMHSMIRGMAVWEHEDEAIYQPFCGTDPDLLFWVLATLIDTTLVLLEKVKGPIPLPEKEQFYQESKITAQLMGIPPESYPDDLNAFYKRYYEILDGDTLFVGTSCVEITKAVFNVPYPIRWFLRLMAAGWLPPKLLFQYQFRFADAQKFMFKVIMKFSKLSYRLLPDKLRYPAHFHQAQYRIAKARGKWPSLLQRLHVWLGDHLDVYFISSKLNPIKKHVFKNQ